MSDLKQKKLRIAVTGASELAQRVEACSRCMAELVQPGRSNTMAPKEAQERMMAIFDALSRRILDELNNKEAADYEKPAASIETLIRLYKDMVK